MCGCISEMDNLLREHNTCLVTTMFRKPDAVAIRTDKVNTRQRGGPATVLATFCPFCGEKYAMAEPVAEAAATNTPA